MRKQPVITSDVIALCHVLYDLPIFNKDLKKILLGNKKLSKIIKRLKRIHCGKTVLFSYAIRKFYNNHKFLIETFSKYSDFFEFVSHNYNDEGLLSNDSIQEIYEYLLDFEEEKDRILILLQKIKSLGFDTFIFDETLNFYQDTYTIFRDLRYNDSFVFLDNIQIIPNFNEKQIEYKSLSSSYRITIDNHFWVIAPSSLNVLEINDLTIDPDRLPNEINTVHTIEHILSLYNQKHSECNAMKNTISLNCGIEELYVVFNSLYSQIQNMTDVAQRQKLLEICVDIKKLIIKMQILSTEYEKDVEVKYNIHSSDIESHLKTYSKKKSIFP